MSPQPAHPQTRPIAGAIRWWAGLLALSGSWLWLHPLFTPDIGWGPGLALAGSGVALLMWSLAAARTPLASGPPAETPAWFAGTGLGVVVFAAQFLSLALLTGVAAHHHQLAFLSPVLQLILALAGVPSSVDQGRLLVQTEEDVLPFATNWDKFGLVMPVGLFAAVTLAVLLDSTARPARLRRWLGGVTLLGLYLIVRYLLLAGWLIETGDPKGTSETDRMRIFTDPWWCLLTHLPFALLAARLRVAVPNPDLFAWGTAATARPVFRLALPALAAAVALGLVAIRLQLPGAPRPGLVLVDDYHSGFWEPAVPSLDTNGYGAKYLYNCSSLVEWLHRFHAVEVNTDQPITADRLRGIAVLILKTPSRRIEAAEIDAILAFVREGGGLLLIGDHTNLLGMGSFLNELARHFGITFQSDASNAYSSGYFSSFRAPRLLAHPVVEGLPGVRFLTSCTVRGGPGVESVMLAHDVMSDPVDYSKPSFFGRLLPSPRNGFGLYPLALARKYGRGQVVAFAESTTLSNFAAFQDGTAPFILLTVTYLRHGRRDLGWLRIALGGAAVLLAALALHRLARAGLGALVAGTVLGAVAGYGAGGLALKAAHRHAFPTPRPVTPFVEVAHLAGRGFRNEIPPAIGPAFVRPEYSFDALFVVPQRLGAFPAVILPHQLRPDRFRAAMAVNPNADVPRADFEQLVRFVTGGGRLLVLQEPQGDDGFVTNLLARLPGNRLLFARRLALPPDPVGVATPTVAVPIPAVTPGQAAAAPPPPPPPPPPDRILTWSAWETGRGMVQVFSDSTLFSRAWLGNVMVEPAGPQRQVYDLAFAALRQMLGPIDRPGSLVPPKAIHSNPGSSSKPVP